MRYSFEFKLECVHLYKETGPYFLIITSFFIISYEMTFLSAFAGYEHLKFITTHYSSYPHTTGFYHF